MSKTEKNFEKLSPVFPFSINTLSSGVISFDLPKLYQIILLKKGKIVFHTPGGDHIISENHVIFIPSASNLPVTNSSACEIIQIIFGQNFIDSIIISGIDDKALKQFHLDNTDRKNKQDMTYIPLDESAFQEISQIANCLTNEFFGKGQGYQSMIRIKFMELLLSIYRCNPPSVEEDVKAVYNTRGNVNKITGYVNERYSDVLTLDNISAHFGLNPSYLSRIFREATGTALFEYINHIRIQKSCMLLKRTTMSIIEIAFSVGYNNISHFNRYFRRIMKMSPREYKNYIKK